MRDRVLSQCERKFLLQALKQNKRIDGRLKDEYRRLRISLGMHRGSCLTELGDTKVLAQASCELVEPTPGRPHEGLLYINLEMSPMAAPHFEAGRLGDAGVECSRLLERCIKESRCLDVESLCVMAGDKVWQIRVDVHVLDFDGALIDCASVATITALMHFRRPDVTVSGEEFTVHSAEERDLIPLNVYHLPICVTFGFTEKGETIIVDPLDMEEKVLEGKIVVGMNNHREICTLHCSGSMLINKAEVLRCTSTSIARVQDITALIRKVIAEDAVARANKKKTGFSLLVPTERLRSFQKDAKKIADVSSTSEQRSEAAEISTKTAPVDIRLNGECIRNFEIPPKSNFSAKKIQTEFGKETKENDSADDLEILEEITKASANFSGAAAAEAKNRNPDLLLGTKKEKHKSKAKRDPNVQSLLDDIEQEVMILEAEKPQTASANAESKLDAEEIRIEEPISSTNTKRRKNRKGVI